MSSLGVRKGAWTEEENNLLRKCIGKFGEGKWHQVPLRAGLNRCRKSCRLRWLNYLKPNIKRGNFSEDEVDLIIRLHKLLGNRWSLIAGRLPGRTANDVKNYWYTNLRKKVYSCKNEENGNLARPPAEVTIVKTNVIKPKPRTFSKSPCSLRGSTGTPCTNDNVSFRNDNLGNVVSTTLSSPSLSSSSSNIEQMIRQKEKGVIGTWPDTSETMSWDNLLNAVEDLTPANADWTLISELLSEEIAPDGAMAGDSQLGKGHSWWSDFTYDMDLWNLSKSDQETINHLNFP